MPGLRELQRELAAQLRAATGDAAAGLDVYRNNVRLNFENALRLTYPVLARRVGPQYFAQLALRYRAAHRSRHGDLHEIGRDFPAFLERVLAGSEYLWLNELARLEWAVAEAAVAADHVPLAVDALANLAPEALERTCFELAASWRLIEATVPVLSVWRANQGSEAVPVDLSTGGERIAIYRCASDGESGEPAPEAMQVRLRRIDSEAEFGLLRALGAGASLGEALEASSLPLEQLPNILRWLFAEGCVARVSSPHAIPKADATAAPCAPSHRERAP